MPAATLAAMNAKDTERRVLDKRQAAPLTSSFVSEDAVLQVVPVSRSTWRRRVKDGTAPRPVKLGNRCLWSRTELEQFVARLLADRGLE